MRVWLAFAVLFGLSVHAVAAADVTLEVQAVQASEPGKKNPQIPASLNDFKAKLQNTVYGTFKDAGKQSASIAPGGKKTVNVGGYSVELSVKSEKGGNTVTVTMMENGKPVGTPMTIPNVQANTPQMISGIGSKDAPTIFFVTVK